MNDTIAVLYEDADLRIHANPASIASASTILVSFTGIGHGMGGIDVQRIEFSGTAHRHGGLIVVTDKNDLGETIFLQRNWLVSLSHWLEGRPSSP